MDHKAAESEYVIENDCEANFSISASFPPRLEFHRHADVHVQFSVHPMPIPARGSPFPRRDATRRAVVQALQLNSGNSLSHFLCRHGVPRCFLETQN